MKPDEVRQKLLDQNIIWIGEEVSRRAFDDTVRSIAELVARGSPPIKLNIMSNGGDVVAGLDIYDLLATYPSVIDGTVVGFARSMAVVILQACTTRFASAHSRILIHHVSKRSISLDVMRSGDKCKEALVEMEKDQASLYQILSKRTGKSIQVITERCAQDEDMTADEALRFGLIDRIVPERPISQEG